MYCAFWYVLEGDTPGKWVALSFGCDMGVKLLRAKDVLGYQVSSWWTLFLQGLVHDLRSSHLSITIEQRIDEFGTGTDHVISRSSTKTKTVVSRTSTTTDTYCSLSSNRRLVSLFGCRWSKTPLDYAAPSILVVALELTSTTGQTSRW